MPTLPKELMHPEWNGVYRDSDHIGKHIGHTNVKVESWIVKLDYQIRDRAFHGSGYFLNLPMLRDHELILTSGNNLFDSMGKTVQKLEVFDFDRNKLEVIEIWHCPLYRSGQNPGHDYAAIKVKRIVPVVECRGFGYSLCLSERDHNPNVVCITGYGQGLRSEEPTTATGFSIQTFGDEGQSLEYKASTSMAEKGSSGSVVWIQYDGYPTALGIQNRRLGKKDGGHARRLTTQLLREIFDWLEVTRNRVKLQADSAQGILDTSSERLCLYFSPEFPFARVKLGHGSSFDVVPAQAVATTANVSYAVSYEGKWVLFDPMRQQVVLQEHLSDRCLFFEDKQPDTSVAIVLAHREGGELFQLRIQGEMIYDFNGEDSESSEVSMVPYPAKIGIQFVCFKFVSYMDEAWLSAHMCGSDGG